MRNIEIIGMKKDLSDGDALSSRGDVQYFAEVIDELGYPVALIDLRTAKEDQSRRHYHYDNEGHLV